MNIFAKDAKVKYGKYIYYQGTVENKIPKGEGTLYLIHPKNKNTYVAKIKGQFLGMNLIENPKIESDTLPAIEIKGKLDLQFKGEKGKIDGLTIDFTDKVFEYNGENYKCAPFKFILSQNPYNWNITTSSSPLEWMKEKWNNTSILNQYIEEINSNSAFMAEKETPIIDPLVKKYKWELSHYVSFFAYYPQLGKIEEVGNISVLNKDCSYVLYNKKRYFYNTKLDTGFAVLLYGDVWDGYRVIDLPENRYQLIYRSTKDPDKVTIWTFPKKLTAEVIERINQQKKLSGLSGVSTYNGTITNIDKVIYGDFSDSDIKFITGVYEEGYDRTKWLNGETLSNLKSRLRSEGLEDDYIAEVISGKKTEAEAKTEQAENNKKIAIAKENYSKRWKGNSVTFSGPLTPNESGKFGFGLLGADPSYFDGKATIVLNSDGSCKFVVDVHINAKALSQGRGAAIQFNAMAQTLSKDSKGEWTIQDNVIYINGKKQDLTISPDNKTIKYKGMFDAKMIQK